MSKSDNSKLFELIKTLSKSEKKHFTVYSKRNWPGKRILILDLFKEIDLQQEYDEERILSKIPDLKASQLSNLKSRLYHQILECLSLLASDNVEMKIRSSIESGFVLYQKGLYLQSLEQLGKGKKLATNFDKLQLLQEITEFEKKIESRHITVSHGQRAEELIALGKNVHHQLAAENAWADMALRMYDFYLKVGHSKNKEEYEQVKVFFEKHVPIDYSNPSFFTSVYKNQSYLLYHYIRQDFSTCYKYGRTWVELFWEEPQFQNSEPELYLKGCHNLLSVLYYCNDLTRFTTFYELMESYIDRNKKSWNLSMQLNAFIYHSIAQLNHYFLQGKFTQGTSIVDQMLSEIEKFGHKINLNRKMVYWYKFGCMYFGAGEHRKCIKFLNKIINTKTSEFKEDLQCFARVLNLISHYELYGNDGLEYQISSTYRFLLKMQDLNEVQKAILRFLRNTSFTSRNNLVEHFSKLKDTLEGLSENKFESRPFLYLDLISWLESKLTNAPIEEVIRRKVG